MADNLQSSIIDLLKSSIAETMKRIYSALPGHVLAFDPVTQLAQVQIGILGQDNAGQAFAIAPLDDVPVMVYGGAEYVSEVAIKPGCEGLILFSARCLDGWLNTGGVAANPIPERRFSLSDALFIPGIRSIPKAIKSHANEGIRLRNADASQYVWLHESGAITATNGKGIIEIAPSGVVTINGVAIDTKGNIVTPTTVKATTVTGTSNVVFGGISGVGHVHPCGDHNTGAPK